MRPHTLHLPHVPFSAIERPRLLKILQAAAEHRLTVIGAPSGYGKTTLVAQFAHQVSCPVVWHTVEENERDVPNLHTHCLALLADIVPDMGSMTPRPGSTASELATSVAERLREVKGDLFYVLDDVHHLVGSPRAEAWLRAFLGLLPATCHLILIGRTLPELPFSQMIARGEVLGVGQGELAFTFEEINLLAQKIGADLSTGEFQRLGYRLEGWPVGIMLALQPLPADLEQALLSGGTGPEALFDTLAASMLDGQPSDLGDFLLASSTLARLTPELCLTVLHLPDGTEHLSQVMSSNLFLSRVANGLVYHPLFRDFLQRQLKARCPTRFVDLHLQAGHWFEENNRLEEAFDHYAAADLWEFAAAVAERVAPAFFSQSKVETLLDWETQLRPTWPQTPRLLFACAMIHADRYQYNLAKIDLHQAEQAFRAQNDPTSLPQIRLLEAKIAHQLGQSQEAIDRVRPLLELPTLTDNLRSYGLAIIGAAYLALGEASTALTYLEAALPLCRATGDAFSTSQVLQDLELAHNRMGRFDDAAVCLQEIVAVRRSTGSAIGLALALNDLGYHQHQFGDYHQAFTTFQEGLSVASRLSEKRAEAYLRWSLGDLQRDRGSFAEAAQLYRKALELTGRSEPALRSNLLTSLSTLRRWQGKLADALSLASEASALAGERGMVLEGLKAQAALWAAHAQSGQVAEAREHLDTVAADLRQRQALPRLAQTWGLAAHAALLASDLSAAQQYFKLIVGATSHPANLQPLVAEIAHTPLLRTFFNRHAAKYFPLVEGLNRLQDALIPAEESAETPPEAIPYSLRLVALGEIRVERDGVPIPTSAWRASAARDLFFYLLFQGPATREQICLDFWPDSSTQHVRSNFHTTLYRARQALGENTLVFEDELYRINPQVEVWCDADELEILVLQAALLPLRSAHTENLWRRAVELYHGEFLPSLDTAWAIARREAVQETFLQALSGLGHCVRARGDFKEAVTIFKRALRVDSYREDIHRAILLCHADQGERKQVVSHFEQLKRLLRQDLAVEPSPETTALVHAILS